MVNSSKKSCPGKLWNGWVRGCTAINKFYSKLFYRWAGIAGTYPKTVIGLSLFISIGLAAGFARINVLNQGERLWFPEENTARDDLDRAEKSFPLKSKPDEFFITMSDGSSILNAKAFKALLMLHNGIIKTKINEICTSTNKSDLTWKSCVIISPLELFQYNESKITDQSIMPTLIESIKNNAALMKNGRPASMNMQHMLGNFKLNSSGGKTTLEGNAVRIQYLVNFVEEDDQYDFLSKVEKKFIDFLLSKEEELKQQGLILYLNAGRSIDDEVSESSGGDIIYVIVSIVVMCIFTTIVLSRVRDLVGGHFWVGMVGLGCIILGIGSSLGLVMASGTYFVSFVGTLPFLVLGVGIDDMFIIIDALDHVNPEIKGVERLQIALGHVGASVTMTTITDLVAFAVSASTQFPAIRYFCAYAALAILFTYLMIVTLLIAFMSLDLKRVEAGKWDVLPCKKNNDYEPWVKSQKSIVNTVMFAWGRFLMKLPVRIAVLIICFGLAGVSVWGATKVEEKFDLRQLSTDGSYFIRFQDERERLFPDGFFISIIQDDTTFDYTDEQNQNHYRDLSDICRNSGNQVPDEILNWMESYLNSSYCTNRSSCTGSNFYPTLASFLKNNRLFESDLRRDNAGIITYSRILCRDKDNADWRWRADAMVKLRDDLKANQNISNLFPITINYFYREQILVVRAETIRNLAVCAAAILVITTPYLVHPVIILIVFLGFVTLVFELFALMAIWNVALNTISMIVSIMAIGFAVDYSAHVAHSFMISNAPTPEERIINALGEIGASVLMGGISTFLGIVVMAFGESEIFRIFFRMVFGIVVIGLLNGLLFLPVLLSVFCRTNLHITGESNIHRVKSSTRRNSQPISPVTDHGQSEKAKNDTFEVIQNPYSGKKVEPLENGVET